MASRNSFLDSPSFSRITTPSQKTAISENRRSSGFRGDGSSSSAISKETAVEKTARLRQESLKSFQSELSDTGTRLSASERQAILDGKPVSEIRKQVVSRQRKQGFASLQRDLSRSGTRLTTEESRLIAQGEIDPSTLKSRIERRRGKEFTSQRTTSFVTSGETSIPVSERFAERVVRDVSSGRLEAAQRNIQAQRTQDFASGVGFGGVSFASGGQGVVTSSGESVAGASTTEFASFVGGRQPERLVTSSGRDVTPRLTVDSPSGFVSRSGRTPFASRPGVQRVLGGQYESQSVADFSAGAFHAITNPAPAFNELFSVGERGRIASSTGSQARFAGQTVGLAGSVGITGLAFRGVGFLAGVTRPVAQRTLSRLGLTTAASRSAAGAVVAPILRAGLLAPEIIQGTFNVATGRSSLGVEALSFGVNRGVEFGAGAAIYRSGRLARSFNAGQRVSEGSRGFTRRGVLGGSNVNQVLSDSLILDVPTSSFTSIRSNQVPSTITFTSAGGANRQFIYPSDVRNTLSFSTTDNLQQTTFRLRETIRNPGFLGEANSVSQPEIAGILNEQGALIGATVFAKGRPKSQINRGFTPEASLITANNQQSLTSSPTAFVTYFNNNILVGLPTRNFREPPTISRGDLRRKLAVLDRFSRGDLVEGSRGVDIVDKGVFRGGQTGLSAFGDISPQAPRSVSGLLIAPNPPFPPGGSRLFSTLDFGIGAAVSQFRNAPSTSLTTRRQSGRLITQPPRSTRLGAGPSRARGVRSRSSQGFFTGFITRINTGLASGLSSAQSPSLASSNRLANVFDVGTSIDSGFRIRSGLRASQSLGVDEALRQEQITSQIIIPRITNPTNPTRPRRPGRPRTPPPRTPRIPDFDLPNINFGLSGRKKQKGRKQRRTTYNPSLVANFLGIKGDKPGLSTGIEIRPIQL